MDTEAFKPVSADTQLAQKYDIKPGDDVLVSAVRLVPLKGIQYAMEAMADLSRKWPNLKMLIAGEGPFKQGLLEKAQELGLAKRVHLVGFRDPTSWLHFMPWVKSVFSQAMEKRL